MIRDTDVTMTGKGITEGWQLDLFGEVREVSVPDYSEGSVSRIGHDLRTALNAIMGYSEVMTHRMHGPLGHPKYDEYVVYMRTSGAALLRVSNEVLALAARA